MLADTTREVHKRDTNSMNFQIITPLSLYALRQKLLATDWAYPRTIHVLPCQTTWIVCLTRFWKYLDRFTLLVFQIELLNLLEKDESHE